VPAWLILVALILFLIGMTGDGFVLRPEMKQPDKHGLVGNVAINIAKIPQTVEDLVRHKDMMKAQRGDRLAGKAGWNIIRPPGADPAKGISFSAVVPATAVRG
jgi:hypothetical protein